MVMGFLGALWGLPWMQVSAEAATVFSSPLSREIFSILFPIGIVVTVGADGLWILLNVARKIANEARIVVLRSGITFICAALSCIPAVYAAFIYNHGLGKLLALITFVGNMGYGLYGYSSLFRTFQKEKSDYLSRHLLKGMIQIVAGLFLAFSAGLVDLFLTKDFLLSTVMNNEVVAFLTAGFTALPALVINFIATKNLAGKVFDVIAQKSYLQTNITLPFVFFMLSLLAPTAAGYIVYHTLLNEQVHTTLIVFATLSIMSARVVFANFTLNNLAADYFAFRAK